MTPEQEMVETFHHKYELPVGTQPRNLTTEQALLRARLIQSEAAEFTDAVSTHDIVASADALVDLLYVTYGAAVTMGIDLQPLFREVHKSNMTKSQWRDRGGKVEKGKDYEPPQLVALLQRQGMFLP